MGILTPEQYEKRRENAARRMAENAEKGAEARLTEAQADALEHLTTVRHDIHTSWDEIFNTESGDTSLDRLLEVQGELEAAGLDAPKWVSDEGDILGHDTPNDNSIVYEICGYDKARARVLKECPKLAEDEDLLRDAIKEELYSMACELYEQLNTAIEVYLHRIDEKYGTNYAPTGAQRI